MTGEETNQIRDLIRKSPRTIWGYWPFVFPILILIVGVVIIVALVVYFERKAPDLQVLFKLGTREEPVWDSQLIREAVMTTVMSIIVTFGLLAFLAWTAFRLTRLLRAAAKELGIEDGEQGGAADGGQPSSSEASRMSGAAGPRR